MDGYKKRKRPPDQGLVGAIRKAMKFERPKVKKTRAGTQFSKRNEKYRRIVEEAKEGICVAQDGKLRFINPAMANLLAYPRKGLVSRPFASFVHPDDLKMVLENHLRRSRGEEAPSTYQFRLVDKNENTKWVETKSVKITWNDRPATLNFIDDITGRKAAEENLRESEERWQFALEGSGDGVWDWNPETNKIHYSRQCKAMLGYKESEFGDSFDEWAKRVHPDDLPGAMAEIDKHFKGETPGYTSEHRILCKGGAYKWFLVRGKAIRRTAERKPLRVIGTRTDITARKEKESALRMFQHSIDNASDAVFWMNRDAGFTYVNAQACRSLGYTREELLDLHLWDIDPLFPKKLWYERWDRYQPGHRGGGEKLESLHRRRDGSTFPIEVISDHLWIDQTELHVAYVRDITERKQAEEALQRSEKDAQTLLQETAIMGEIGRIISSTLDIGKVYDRFAAEVKKLVPFDRISIVEANPAEGWGALVYDAGIEVITRRSGDHFPLAGSVTGLLLQNQSGLIIQGRAMEEFSQRNPGYLPIYQAGFRSMMAVPLILRDQFVGTLGLNSLQPECYSEHHLKIAERIGNHIAGAVANARLFSQRKRAEAALKKSEEEARRLAQENAIMAEIGRIVGSTWDIRTVYDRFSETVRKLLPFDRMAINIPNLERKTLMIPYVSGKEVSGLNEGECIPLRGTIAEEVVRTRSSILIRQEELKDFFKRFPGLSVLAGSGFTSMLSVPLISKEQVIGVLNLRLAGGRSYETADLKLAEKVGAQIAGAIANAQLFAERQQAERALRHSEEKYRLLVENAKDAIFIIQDGAIKFSNLQTEKLFGYSAAELAAIPFSNHIHPSDREITREGNPEELEAGKYPQPQSFRIRNKSGMDVWLELRSIGIEWEGEKANLNFASDITEQKKLEAQFLQAQKMEAVGRLAGGVAHDFNNLLTVINANSQLGMMELKEFDPLREKFDSIQKAGQKATNLTRQLLAFSRRQAMEMKVLDLNMILQDLEKMLRRLIGEDIELTAVLHKNLGRIKADPGQIEQAVLNLVINARDAMPSGGKLTIETCNVNIDREYALSHMGIKPGRFVMLSVSDNGVGMKPEIQERIFEPFFTTKEKGKGTGLGLSTVYGVAKQSGGDISVYSELGSGTTFKIYFPQVDEPLEETGKKATRMKMQGGHETILVVEDEDEVRKLAVGILKKHGYNVLEASHGGDAILLCEQYKEPIHLLLSDVIMPGMSGPDFAHRLKYFFPEIKVLFMSGYTDNALFQNGFLDGAVFFLQKPFSVGKLTEKVREVLDQ